MSNEQPATAAPASDLRGHGMHDLGPDEMERFRAVEARFLDVAGRAGYREIRTPTVEPLHLFTGAGTLSPQMLDRVYSFLDWDGWSGERVVLRPDSTLPAVRWHEERAGGDSARLCYVQPVYRFAPDDGQREQWQCGVELFGLTAPEGDAELLRLARELLTGLGLSEVRFELSHSGLVRAALGAAGLDRAAQLAAYDRLLDGDAAAIAELVAANPEQAGALRVLFEVDGGGEGYLANLRAALAAVPEAEQPIAEIEAAARAFAGAGSACAVAPASARGFEYYTGVTFRAFAGDSECLRGGRYDGLAERIRREARTRLGLRGGPAAAGDARAGRRGGRAMSSSAAIRVALPRGELRAPLAERLAAAGFVAEGYGKGSRAYRFEVTGRPLVAVRVFSDADIPIQVALGQYDLGVTSRAWVDELVTRFGHDSIVPLRALDLGDERRGARRTGRHDGGRAGRAPPAARGDDAPAPDRALPQPAARAPTTG